MKKITSYLLSICFMSIICFMSNIASADTLKGEKEFCTKVGPVTLFFNNEQVDGHYRIITKNTDITGALKLTWKAGKLTGTWIDSHGQGAIHLFFHNKNTKLTMLYNSISKGKSSNSWFEPWLAIRSDALTAEDKGFICKKQQ